MSSYTRDVIQIDMTRGLFFILVLVRYILVIFHREVDVMIEDVSGMAMQKS